MTHNNFKSKYFIHYAYAESTVCFVTLHGAIDKVNLKHISNLIYNEIIENNALIGIYMLIF